MNPGCIKCGRIITLGRMVVPLQNGQYGCRGCFSSRKGDTAIIETNGLWWNNRLGIRTDWNGRRWELPEEKQGDGING